MDVLFEDNHLVAINKPAGLLSMGDETGDPSAVDVIKAYLKAKYQKPGEVFLGVVHRLDRPVSGVLVFARTSKAASRLSDQFRQHHLQKTYLALVSPAPTLKQQSLVDWLIKNPATNVSSVVPAATSGAKECRLSFETLGSHAAAALLKIVPETGRGHQIRVQLSHAGYPIIGDKKYGSKEAFGPEIALHAHRLTITHPTLKTEMTIEAPTPPSWQPRLSSMR